MYSLNDKTYAKLKAEAKFMDQFMEEEKISISIINMYA